MIIKDTKISRHENPDLMKVEFVSDEDTVMICMRGEGVNDLPDDQAIGRARSVMSSCLNDRDDPELASAGVDQTFSQP